MARANSPYGKLLVTESDGQFDFIENGVPLTSTRDDQRMEEAVHYAMAQRPEARQVLLVGGGISGTARELLKYNVRRVDYVELDPLILEFGRKYLPESLAGSRIKIINTDGRLFVKQTGERYEVVIVDVPEPATAQLNRFFTAEFLAEIKRVLSPDGVVSFSFGHYENYVSPELARMLASAGRSLRQSFPNALVIPGGKVFFLGSDGPLFANIAERIEQQGVKTKLMNRHYLDAMMTGDRMADLQNALAQPAALNQDFNPALYFYHLRHWMSQFKTGFGALHIMLLALLCVYLVRLRGTAFVLFASGFAATTLEIVLLLAFQVLCGSVYHQLGIIVTVFMAGLALGAMLANRRRNRSNGVMEDAQLSRAAVLPPHDAITPPLQCPRRAVPICPTTFLGRATAKLVGLRCRAAQTSLPHPPIHLSPISPPRSASLPSRLRHRRLRHPARILIAAIKPAGRHGRITPLHQGGHCASDFDSGRAGGNAIPAGQPPGIRRHGFRRVAPLHGGFHRRIPGRNAGERAPDSVNRRDRRLPPDRGPESCRRRGRLARKTRPAPIACMRRPPLPSSTQCQPPACLRERTLRTDNAPCAPEPPRASSPSPPHTCGGEGRGEEALSGFMGRRLSAIFVKRKLRFSAMRRSGKVGTPRCGVRSAQRRPYQSICTPTELV